jgi:uncharacterized protein (DUF4415 family)
MSKTEKDYEYLETSPEAQAAGLKRITRPKFLDKLSKDISLHDGKSRITIYIDSNIIDFFKKQAENSEAGYQTLINNTLKTIVNSELNFQEKLNLKKDLLEDKEFLQELKERLAA